MKLLLLAQLLTVLSACHKSVVPAGNNCTYLVKGEDKVSVCLDKVINDSRCPPDVECIWEGYAIVRFEFTKNNASTFIDLSTPRSKVLPGIPSVDTTLQGYHIELLSLSFKTDTSGKPHAEVSITPQ